MAEEVVAKAETLHHRRDDVAELVLDLVQLCIHDALVEHPVHSLVPLLLALRLQFFIEAVSQRRLLNLVNHLCISFVGLRFILLHLRHHRVGLLLHQVCCVLDSPKFRSEPLYKAVFQGNPADCIYLPDLGSLLVDVVKGDVVLLDIVELDDRVLQLGVKVHVEVTLGAFSKHRQLFPDFVHIGGSHGAVELAIVKQRSQLANNVPADVLEHATGQTLGVFQGLCYKFIQELLVDVLSK